MRRIGRVIGSFVAVATFLLTSFGTSVSAEDIGGMYVYFKEDTSKSVTLTFPQVLHRFRSWYYYKNDYDNDKNLRITLIYVERRYHQFWDWDKSLLLWAQLKIKSYNVDISFDSSSKQGKVLGEGYKELGLYYYAPTDGSVDGSNAVGQQYPLRYLEIHYDLPQTFSSSIYRPHGRYIKNTVTSYKYRLTPSEASRWRWVPVANLAHHDPGVGHEIEAYAFSCSWRIYWDWGCWCWKPKYYCENSGDEFYIN